MSTFHGFFYFHDNMLSQKQVKSVLNKHKQRDTWFLDDYSVNAYEGCSCNCQYCYIRGSKYGENMADKLSVKSNVLEVLAKQLKNRAAKQEYGFVAIGSSTDAYMPHEANLQLTRGILELMLAYRFPVFISTKRELIKRDLDLLKEIDRKAILPLDLQGKLSRGVILSVSVSTMDDTIAKTIEPGAIPPLQRFELIAVLKEEGFLAGVNAIPLLPFISDETESLDKMIASAKAHNADYILTGGLTLFGTEAADSKTLYYKFLERYDSSLIEKYDKLYGDNFYAPRWYHKQLEEKVKPLCTKHNIRNSILIT